jgi:hypothetical protein
MENEDAGQLKLSIFDSAQTKLEDFSDTTGPTDE